MLTHRVFGANFWAKNAADATFVIFCNYATHPKKCNIGIFSAQPPPLKCNLLHLFMLIFAISSPGVHFSFCIQFCPNKLPTICVSLTRATLWLFGVAFKDKQLARLRQLLRWQPFIMQDMDLQGRANKVFSSHVYKSTKLFHHARRGPTGTNQ